MEAFLVLLPLWWLFLALSACAPTVFCIVLWRQRPRAGWRLWVLRLWLWGGLVTLVTATALLAALWGAAGRVPVFELLLSGVVAVLLAPAAGPLMAAVLLWYRLWGALAGLALAPIFALGWRWPGSLWLRLVLAVPLCFGAGLVGQGALVAAQARAGAATLGLVVPEAPDLVDDLRRALLSGRRTPPHGVACRPDAGFIWSYRAQGWIAVRALPDVAELCAAAAL